MNVISASDCRYLPGLLVTWASILIADDDRYIQFYLLHDGISEPELSKFELSLRRISQNFTIRAIAVDAACFSEFPEFFFDSKMTYARLLAADLVPADRAIYVDTDFLCLRGLAEVWDADLGGASLGVCAEHSHGGEGDELLLQQAFPAFAGHTYFNAGLLLMDLASIRDTGLFRRALQVLVEYKDAILWWDQSALNLVSARSCAYLDPDLNFQLKLARECGYGWIQALEERRVNLHYVTKAKPWIISGYSLSSRVFRACASTLRGMEETPSSAVPAWRLALDVLRHAASSGRLAVVSLLSRDHVDTPARLARDHWTLCCARWSDLRAHKRISRVIYRLASDWKSKQDQSTKRLL
jgi:lipopolysaccharide biosynthesis glycosyltransferase